ncbi:MAG: replicative DNA helicase [Bacteroidetes bacterium GWF2_38_335]|nr:MAG: replicative DNA helicase [Bacteroidetes bacterium GWF2_38_335]OFY80103.1 MAG: replicative DNA helicase [Bacteroidetes bacterium RIFOXYA12_FULL_38_20]HBS88571.1 replicative DNA helicase [Bacteroidales bacterium]
MAEKYKAKTAPVINLEYGKVPPQALDLEEAVLGALMLEKNTVVTVLDVLKPDSFYKEAHQKIFSAIVSISTRTEPIDILTVTEELRKNGLLDEVGGPFYITQLTNRVASAAHVEFHARIIAQKYIQRELIRISTEIQGRAFDDSIDVFDLLNFSEDQLFKVAEGNIKKETTKIDILIKEAIQMIEEASKREDGLSGVPSGFTGIDRITSGWQKSDLVIIAARPSMGKTAFVLSLARNMAVDHNRPVAIFSLEMASVQLVNRLIIAETGLNSEKVKNGRLERFEWEQLEIKIKNLTDKPIYIDDTPAITIFELRAKCRRLKMQYNVEVIIIDYLQLMSAGGDNKGNREQEVSMISRSLKAIAKELGVCIIALSQLNRSVETRGGNKKPQLSDLRESGAIEQDADMVLFIHRPEYYGLTSDEAGNSLIGIAEIIIAKHRNGATGDVQLKFIKEQAKFVELDPDFSIPEGFSSYSSKMNIEDKSGNFDITANKDFEDNNAPF